MRIIYRWFLALLLAGVGFTIVHGAPLPIQQVSGESIPWIASRFSIRVYPDGPLYAGDQVSFDVFSPPNLEIDSEELKTVEVRLAGEQPGEPPLGQADFSPDEVNGGYKATLRWVWDTAEILPGSYTLDFRTAPRLYEWSETLTLLPRAELPPRLADAAWVTTQAECCTIYTVSGTEGERDLAELEQMAVEETANVLERFSTTLEDPIAITFLPRVKGHGGFASNEVYVSYLDRNYAGSTTRQVLRHEIVHYVDAKLGGDYRPTIFIEGLAVYLSGGHFKPEPLLERAAVLASLSEYQDLTTLADNFYENQHEAGYLEAGALVEYMVDTWGWDRFNEFYRGMKPPEGEKPSSAIDSGLRQYLGIGLADLEERFKSHLGAIQTDPRWAEDVRLTIAFYDTVRRYQQVLDPSAYFRGVWLPDPKEMRERGIVADYLRRPEAPINNVLESLLVAADERLRAGDFPQVELLLSKVNATLDHQERLVPYQKWIRRVDSG